MKTRLFILLTLILTAAQLSAQSGTVKPLDYISDGTLEAGNVLDQYVKYDFSRVITFESPSGRIGYIGKNYQRIKVRLISVIKNADNPSEYMVFGKTNVKDNVCDFQGVIRIKEIRKVKGEPLEAGQELDAMDATNRGMIIAEYTFYENPAQTHVGMFNGNMLTQFYIDNKGVAQYDDSGLGRDGYSNNHFIGDWVGYDGVDKRACNWGDYRVPNSGDLDQGAGEFSPADQYLKNGWANFRKAWLENDAKAKLDESKVWW